MKLFLSFVRRWTLLIFIFILSGNGYAQYYKIQPDYSNLSKQFDITDIKIKKIKEATKSGSGSSAVTPAKYDMFWYRIEVTYNSQFVWADGVIFKYYVLMREKNSQRSTLLVGDVEYNSVPRSSNLNSLVFIHPRTIQRYGKPEKVMCEIWYQGVRICRHMIPKGNKEEWWVKYRPLEGDLKVKYFTPFAQDKDIYEENINIKALFK